MARLASVLVLLVALALPAGAAAAPPPNDDFAAAADLALGSSVNLSLLDATGQPGERLDGNIHATRCATPGTAPNCTATAWYRITPPAGEFTVETCDRGTGFDTVLRLQTGATLTGTQVQLNDDGCGVGGGSTGGSQVSATADGTTTYRVQVAGYRRSTGRAWLRAYAGAPQAAPAVDTAIRHYQSVPYLDRFEGPTLLGDGTGDGPRQTASFSFRAPDSPGATFQCALDDGAFAACASPVSYDALQSGTHELAVRAIVGGVPDPTPARQTFTVDRAGPDTTLVSGPTGPTAAELAFVPGASEPVDGHDVGLCAFDRAPLAPCSLYASNEAAGTCLGPHTFTAQASDRGGNLDPTPLVATPTRTSGVVCAPPTIIGMPGGAQAYGGFGSADIDAGGYVGTVRLDFGTTTAYGRSVVQAFGPGNGSVNVGMTYLQPSTTYHYQLSFETPLGTVATADETMTTEAAPASPQTVTTGDPVAVGAHALRVPVSFTTAGNTVSVGAFVAKGTSAGPESAKLAVDTTPSADGTLALDAIDLEPETTYTVRAWLETAGRAFLGAPKTVTTGAVPPPTPGDTVTPGGPAPPTGALAAPIALSKPAPRPARFRLATRNVTVAKSIRRRATSIQVVLRDLPARTKAGAVVSAGKTRLGTASGTARSGKVTLKIKLGTKARRALKRKKLKKLALAVTATPPGQAASKLTFAPKLK